MTRLAVCGFTTMDTAYEEDLELAREFDLPAIGICEAKLTDDNEEEQLARFRDSGLECASALPAMLSPLPTEPPGLYPGPTDPDARTALMMKSIDRLAPYEPASIVFATGTQGDRTRDEAEAIAVEAFRAVCRHAAERGVSLSLEPIRNVGFDATWIRTFRDAVDFIDLVGAPNLTLCFDVYHLWDDPEVLDLVSRYGDRIGAVQISDWHEPPRARADRLIPGEGTIDLSSLIGALERAGYRGTYDVEIFSDDGRWGTPVPGSVWAMDPREVYRRSIAGFTRAWQARETPEASR